MNSRQCGQHLIELLEAHNARIDVAIEYLDDIKTAIAENRLDNLQQSLDSPELAVDDIEQLERQRHELLTRYGFNRDGGGFEKCVRWCDNEQKQVSKLYQQLIQGLVQLQHSIQINNLLVSKGRDRVRRSLGILTGLNTAGNCKIYSNKGKTLSPSDQRNIAVA